jgi:hypothetical protein
VFPSLKKALFVLLAAVSVQAGPPKLAFDDDEDELRGCADFLQDLGVHEELFRVLLGVSITTVEDLWISNPMRQFVPPAHHSEDPWENAPLLVDYLDRAFAGYARKAALTRQRGKSLAEAVRAHGMELPPTLSRKAFENRSKANLQALLQNRTYVMGQSGMEAAEKAVSALTPVFTHNAPRKVDVPASALVSSQQLEQMGFAGGLNTSAFNKWLRADDQVFFFVHLQRTDGTRAYSQRNMALAYGDAVATLEPKTASAAGWVSAYVMDPDDLLEYGAARFPERTAQLRQLVAQEFGVSADRSRVVEEGLGKRGIPISGAWGELARHREMEDGFNFLRLSLHELDLTVDDFHKLLQQQVLLELEALKGTPDFQKRVTQLEGGTAREMGEALHDLFFTPLRLPRDFELKVPVAVPPGALRSGH